jgi:hypothetical protein
MSGSKPLIVSLASIASGVRGVYIPHFPLFRFVLASFRSSPSLYFRHPLWWTSPSLALSNREAFQYSDGFGYLFPLRPKVGQHFVDIHLRRIPYRFHARKPEDRVHPPPVRGTMNSVTETYIFQGYGPAIWPFRARQAGAARNPVTNRSMLSLVRLGSWRTRHLQRSSRPGPRRRIPQERDHLTRTMCGTIRRVIPAGAGSGGSCCWL